MRVAIVTKLSFKIFLFKIIYFDYLMIITHWYLLSDLWWYSRTVYEGSTSWIFFYISVLRKKFPHLIKHCSEYGFGFQTWYFGSCLKRKNRFQVNLNLHFSVWMIASCLEYRMFEVLYNCYFASPLEHVIVAVWFWFSNMVLWREF